MAAVELRPTQLSDLGLLLKDMRPLDLAEVRAASGPNVLGTLVHSFKITPTPESAWADGKLLAIRGTVPTAGGAVIWMLGTNALGRYKGAHTRLAKEYIAQELKVHHMLFNYVHAKNTPSVRWLERLGFTVDAPIPFATSGELFHPFWMRANV